MLPCTRFDAGLQRWHGGALGAHALRLGVALAAVLIIIGGQVHASFNAERADRAWMHSAISYCKVSDDDVRLSPSVLDWDCEFCYRDNVDSFEILRDISGSGSMHDTQAYVGVDPQLQECVVAFRGSQEPVDWIHTNLNIYRLCFTIPPYSSGR